MSIISIRFDPYREAWKHRHALPDFGPLAAKFLHKRLMTLPISRKKASQKRNAPSTNGFVCIALSSTCTDTHPSHYQHCPIKLHLKLLISYSPHMHLNPPIFRLHPACWILLWFVTILFLNLILRIPIYAELRRLTTGINCCLFGPVRAVLCGPVTWSLSVLFTAPGTTQVYSSGLMLTISYLRLKSRRNPVFQAYPTFVNQNRRRPTPNTLPSARFRVLSAHHHGS